MHSTIILYGNQYCPFTFTVFPVKPFDLETTYIPSIAEDNIDCMAVGLQAGRRATFWPNVKHRFCGLPSLVKKQSKKQTMHTLLAKAAL